MLLIRSGKLQFAFAEGWADEYQIKEAKLVKRTRARREFVEDISDMDDEMEMPPAPEAQKPAGKAKRTAVRKTAAKKVPTKTTPARRKSPVQKAPAKKTTATKRKTSGQ